MKKRILVVDDHPIVREGLALLINRERDLAVCGEASGAKEAMQALKTALPDLILMDISLEGANGIELTKNLRARCPDVPVLMLSMHDEALYAERVLKAGARGYLMKQEAPTVVLKAIRQVLAGHIFVSDRISSRLLQDMSNCRNNLSNRMGLDRLSDRQLEVFDLLGHGKTTRDIASKLGVSIKTVEAHRSHIRTKLKLRNAAELTHRAIRWVESGGAVAS